MEGRMLHLFGALFLIPLHAHHARRVIGFTACPTQNRLSYRWRHVIPSSTSRHLSSPQNSTVVLFRTPSRNTYGFADAGGRQPLLPLAELEAVLGEALNVFRLRSTESLVFTVHGAEPQQIAWAVTRCTLTHGVFEILSIGSSHQEAADAAPLIKLPAEAAAWRVGVLNVKRAPTLEERHESLLPFLPKLPTVGRIRDEKQQVDDFAVIEDGPVGASRLVLFGRWLARGSAVGYGYSYSITKRRPRAGVLNRLALHRRLFTSPTAMEPEIALVMANMARVGKQASVLDPFSGSCSLLLAASYLGAAQVVGVDSDRCIVEEQEPLIRQSFMEAQLDVSLELHHGDAMNLSHQAFQKELYDAIVTDPPYNLKAKVQTGMPAESLPQEDETCRMSIDQARAYSAIEGLLRLAEKTLRPGGRLVFLLPWWHPEGLPKDEAHEQGVESTKMIDALLPDLPPGLTLVSGLRQSFTASFSRFLVIVTKDRYPQEGLQGSMNTYREECCTIHLVLHCVMLPASQDPQAPFSLPPHLSPDVLELFHCAYGLELLPTQLQKVSVHSRHICKPIIPGALQ